MARKTRNQKIAELINTCIVSAQMQDKVPAGDMVSVFFRAECRATIELADKYGIELPSLPAARAYMAYHNSQTGKA